MTHQENSETIQYLTFQVDDRLLGIPVLRVRDVFVAQKITPIPLAPKEVSGLVNLRGHIVTSISLREKLCITSIDKEQKQMNIAVECDGEVYSLLVDSVGDAMDLPLKNYEKKPQVLDEKVRDFASGVFKLKDKLLVILDVDSTIQTCQ